MTGLFDAGIHAAWTGVLYGAEACPFSPDWSWRCPLWTSPSLADRRAGRSGRILSAVRSPESGSAYGHRDWAPMRSGHRSLSGIQASRARGAGKVEQVRPLGLIELQRVCEAVDHALGNAGGIATLEPDVVLALKQG